MRYNYFKFRIRSTSWSSGVQEFSASRATKGRATGVTDDSAEGSLSVSLQGLEVLSALELVRSACRELL